MKSRPPNFFFFFGLDGGEDDKTDDDDDDDDNNHMQIHKSQITTVYRIVSQFQLINPQFSQLKHINIIQQPMKSYLF